MTIYRRRTPFGEATPQGLVALRIARASFDARLLRDQGDEAGALELEAEALGVEAGLKVRLGEFGRALDLEDKAREKRSRAYDLRFRLRLRVPKRSLAK